MWAFQRWWAEREPARPFCNSPGKWGPWQGRLRLRTLASDKKATPMSISQRLSNCQSETSRITPKPLNWSHQFIFVVLLCWFLKQRQKKGCSCWSSPHCCWWCIMGIQRDRTAMWCSWFLVVFQPVNPNGISIKAPFPVKTVQQYYCHTVTCSVLMWQTQFHKHGLFFQHPQPW